jgi:hypothetical protein
LIVPWFLTDPTLLESIEAEVERDFPGLRVLIIDSKVFIQGRLDVFCDSAYYDSYGISIKLSDNHPIDLPQVFETENRLPKTMDRHFYQDNKSACLFVPFERGIFWSNPRSISQFIGGAVNAFFYSQSFFDRNGHYPFGDRAHGLPGVLESTKELFDLNTNRQAILIMDAIQRDDTKGHWLCPCGSEKIFRKCHRNRVTELKRTNPVNYAAFVMYLVADTAQKYPVEFRKLLAI